MEIVITIVVVAGILGIHRLFHNFDHRLVSFIFMHYGR